MLNNDIFVESFVDEMCKTAAMGEKLLQAASRKKGLYQKARGYAKFTNHIRKSFPRSTSVKQSIALGMSDPSGKPRGYIGTQIGGFSKRLKKGGLEKTKGIVNKVLGDNYLNKGFGANY